MWKNNILDQVCKSLAYHPPDWDLIRRRFVGMHKYKSIRQLSNLVGEIGEIHVGLTLEKIASCYPEYLMKVSDVNVRENNIFTAYYTKSGSLTIQRRGLKDSSAEYDKVIEIGDNKVIFEVKLGKYRTNKKGGINTIPGLLKNNGHEKRLTFAHQLFGRDIGFVLVVARDVYEQIIRSNRLMQFFQDNGNLVPLYNTRTGFQQDAKQMLYSWKVPYMDKN